MRIFLGWLGLFILCLIFVSQIYSYILINRAFSLLEKNGENERFVDLISIKAKGARSRMRWLKLKLPELPKDVEKTALKALKADSIVKTLFLLLIGVWFFAMVKK